MPEKIGNSRKTHPLPIRLRSVHISKDQGGAEGYRGRGYAKARKRALYLARGRSTQTGLDAKDARLEVDHINPYKAAGGITSNTNRQVNLRITDQRQNRFIDYAEGAQEKPKKRFRSL
jgi:hypothetical protein